jgi:hypothetical protein
LNLNPNGIFQVSVFVHFCEAFVGIKPHWILFRKFFRAYISARRSWGSSPTGSCSGNSSV